MRNSQSLEINNFGQKLLILWFFGSTVRRRSAARIKLGSIWTSGGEVYGLKN